MSAKLCKHEAHEDREPHRHELPLISRLSPRSGNIPCTGDASPFTHLPRPPPPEFPLQVYPCALHEKRKRQHPVEEGEPYSCIEHSRHIGRYPVDTKVTNQWRRGGRSRRGISLFFMKNADRYFLHAKYDDNV